MKKDWYKDWFSSELYLSVYQHRDEEDAAQLCKLILNSTQVRSGANILDAACGAGRHAQIFSSLGYEVVGFDLSKTLLNVAKESSNQNPFKPKYFCCDIRNVPLNNRFDLITNLFTSFGYFESDEENFSFFNQAFFLLKENGYYILDYFNEKTLRETLVAQSEKEFGDVKILEKRKIENGRVIKEINVLNKENDFKFYESVKLHSCDEIMNKAKQIGFSVHSLFGDYSGNVFSADKSSRLIAVFKK